MALNGKIRSLIGAAWTYCASKVLALWNYSVDPPPAHLKFYFWLVLAVSVGGYFLWAPVVNTVASVLSRPHVAENRPFGLISPIEVITSVPPAPVADVAPVTVKVVEVETKKVVKRKRKAKPKCNAVFC